MSSDDEMSGGGTDRADGIARLLRAAGRRDGPPPGSRDRTFQVAHDVWLRSLRQRRRRRWHAASLAAACATVAITALWWWHRPELQAPVVAHIERGVGVMQARLPEHDDWADATPATAGLPAGGALRTAAAARAALRFAGGTSVRLDHATEIMFLSAHALRLVAGRVYVDTGARTSGPAFRIETAGGSVRDVGTQFEVLYDAGTCRIRVREGRIVADMPGGDRVDGAAGQELLSRAGRPFTRSAIDVRDGAWSWIEAAAVAPATEGQPIQVVLDWVARETRRSIRFESAQLERRAAQAVLHGSIRDLAPLEALRVTLASLDLDYTVTQDGALLIRSRASAP